MLLVLLMAISFEFKSERERQREQQVRRDISPQFAEVSLIDPNLLGGCYPSNAFK